MVQNHTFRFRVSKAQYDKVKQEAKSRGYVRLAPYIRDIMLDRNQLIEEKIIETNNMVKKILEAIQ